MLRLARIAWAWWRWHVRGDWIEGVCPFYHAIGEGDWHCERLHGHFGPHRDALGREWGAQRGLFSLGHFDKPTPPAPGEGGEK